MCNVTIAFGHAMVPGVSAHRVRWRTHPLNTCYHLVYCTMLPHDIQSGIFLLWCFLYVYSYYFSTLYNDLAVNVQHLKYCDCGVMK